MSSVLMESGRKTSLRKKPELKPLKYAMQGSMMFLLSNLLKRSRLTINQSNKIARLLILEKKKSKMLIVME